MLKNEQLIKILFIWKIIKCESKIITLNNKYLYHGIQQ